MPIKDAKDLPFRPEAYNLKISINAHSNSYKGNLLITGKKLGRPSQRITLTQNHLKVSHAQVFHLGKQGESEVKLSRINHLNSASQVRLHTAQTLFAGNYKIKLEFSGRLSEKNKGLLKKDKSVLENTKQLSAYMPCVEAIDVSPKLSVEFTEWAKPTLNTTPTGLKT